MSTAKEQAPSAKTEPALLSTAEAPTVQLEGIHYRTGLPVRVSCSQGRIVSVEPLPAGRTGEQDRHTEDSRKASASLPLIGPGFVDLQLNGYRGRDFNTVPLADNTVTEAVRLAAEAGVTTFFPTIITNSGQAIQSACRAVAEARAADPLAAQCIAGIHLEGPFLSPEDGARGAHDARYIQAPDWALFQSWQEAADGGIRIVTLSPEWPQAPEFIRRCAESGVVVSIGHTSASAEQIREAAAAGATMSTHFGNGAHSLLPRHPNYLWEQMAADELWTCLIADGFHLPDAVLKVAMKVKGERALLVSDAVMLAGMPSGAYETHVGGRVVLSPEGRLQLADNPKLLAGSAQMLPWGIAHLAKRGLCSLADAWDMASIRPAAKLGLPVRQGLAAGAPADLLLADWDGRSLGIRSAYKAGACIYNTT